ncbi:MAG TPA: hypothetical protein VMW77_04260 [Methanoregula sp.]|nr:hypothetical protein [Methanoregula sp.]
MVDISDEYPNQQKNRSHRWLEIAVPFFSFGGAFIAILFPILGIPLDFHVPAMGCVLASCFLAYLAWIRPRKDIVALTTPIYSVIFFSFPIDYSTALVLQVLYAVSLTLMLVRLKYRFGTPGTAASLGKELGGTLKTYIEQTRDAFGDISPEAAHRAAVIFVRFAEGNYDDAIQSSKDILNDGENPDYVSPLIRAFSIIQEHLTINNQSLPHPVTYLKFSENDTPLLAKPTVPADDEDMEFYTALDNALLLLYSVAWNKSERDRAHLLVCQAFAQKLMSST